MWKVSLPPLLLAFLLTACVDTTGVNPESTKAPRGNSQSPVVVEEFSDLQCPACKRAHTAIVQPLLQRFSTEIAFHFRHFPLRSIHAFAQGAAEAAECAADQGKFWEFIEATYVDQEKLAKTDLLERASELNLDRDLFQRCLSSKLKRTVVSADVAEGKRRGVNGTPTFFVNRKLVTSTLEDLDAAIVKALEGA